MDEMKRTVADEAKGLRRKTKSAAAAAIRQRARASAPQAKAEDVDEMAGLVLAGERRAQEALSEQVNRGFRQIYDRGFDRLQQLAELAQGGSAVPLRLWVFLASHADNANAVNVLLEQLAEELGVSKRTVIRAADHLEELGAIIRLKHGTATVYALNPEEVWSSWNESKRYAPFLTKTLISKADNEVAAGRLKVLFSADKAPAPVKKRIERAKAAKPKKAPRQPEAEPTPAELEAAGQQRLPLGEDPTTPTAGGDDGDPDLAAIMNAA